MADNAANNKSKLLIIQFSINKWEMNTPSLLPPLMTWPLHQKGQLTSYNSRTKFKKKNTGKSLITDLSVGFFGFEIKQDQKAKTISINQSAYIQRVVKKFNLTNAKPISTPMEQELNFLLNNALRQ